MCTQASPSEVELLSFSCEDKNLINPFTPMIKMQILRTIHIENVWVMLWELIATSAIVWAKYKMPCSPLCTSYLWVEFEGRTFTLITFGSERVNISIWGDWNVARNQHNFSQSTCTCRSVCCCCCFFSCFFSFFLLLSHVLKEQYNVDVCWIFSVLT